MEDDAKYADGKGRQYYIDYLVNQSSIRQWSLKKLADYGFDAATGVWAECPGYSSVVVGDYASFVSLFDENLGMDLTKEIPVLPKAVEAMPQYLFPNRMVCGFGIITYHHTAVAGTFCPDTRSRIESVIGQFFQ